MYLNLFNDGFWVCLGIVNGRKTFVYVIGLIEGCDYFERVQFWEAAIKGQGQIEKEVSIIRLFQDSQQSEISEKKV